MPMDMQREVQSGRRRKSRRGGSITWGVIDSLEGRGSQDSEEVLKMQRQAYIRPRLSGLARVKWMDKNTYMLRMNVERALGIS